MRLFTAIEIPAPVKDHLRGLLDHLRPAAKPPVAKLSWTRVEDLHITTKFIGEWPEQRLEEMKLALAKVGSIGAFDIAIRGLGWFPNPSPHPRVLWAGVIAGSPLQALAHATESAVHALGVAKENREYSPHLTLARIREGAPLEALHRAIDSLPSCDFGSFRATGFHLYLSAAGRYTQLAAFSIT